MKHIIIQTCQMMGVKVLKYLQSFFKKFSDGHRGYARILSEQLTIDQYVLNFTQSSRKRGYSKVPSLKASVPKITYCLKPLIWLRCHRLKLI